MDSIITWAQQNHMNTRNYYGERTDIVSLMAYLTGVRKSIFENSVEPPQLEVYDRLETNKAARIVRNMCIIRTAMLKNAGRLGKAARMQSRNIFTVAEYIPQSAVDQLSQDGIDLYGKSAGGSKKGKKIGSVKAFDSASAEDAIILLNRHIADRINNVKGLFPLWLNWNYIKDIFIMPDGMNKAAVLDEEGTFQKGEDRYPYQVYINWSPADVGNLYFHDRKFVESVYSWHHDIFTEYSKVKSVREPVKDEIYNFINDSEQIVLLVDCENSDAYKLCATLQDLNSEKVQKISKIILCDDEKFTPSAWRIFQEHVQIPTDHIQCDRIKGDKSIVDAKLIAAASKECYRNNVDSFIIVSSDSDYWGLISSLEEARFLLLVEREKMGAGLREKLRAEEITYAYIDDFYAGDSLGLAQHALVQEINRRCEEMLPRFNLNDFLLEILQATGVRMSKAEKAQFYDRYMKSLQLVISPEGEVSLALNIR